MDPRSECFIVFTRIQPYRWMHALQDAIGHRLLCHLVIPGSHDSMTYTISPESRIGNDQSVLFKYETLLWHCASQLVRFNCSLLLSSSFGV